MSWFKFPATCAHCDSPLRLINGSSNGALMVGVFACTSCRREWTVEARLRPLHSINAHRDRSHRVRTRA